MKKIMIFIMTLGISLFINSCSNVKLNKKIDSSISGNQERIVNRPSDHPSHSNAYKKWISPRTNIPNPPSSVWNYQLNEEEIKDTYIRNEGGYTNDNFGTGPFLIIGERPNSGFRRILMQFPNTLISKAVEVQKEGQRIYLQLFKHAHSYFGKPIPVKIVPIVANWIEGDAGLDHYLDGVCWGANGIPEKFNQPSYHKTKWWNSELWASNSEWAELDLTEIFKEWYTGGIQNQGLMIQMQSEEFGSGLGDHLYASTSYGDSAGWPYLAVR